MKNEQQISLCLAALEDDTLDCIELCRDDPYLLENANYINFKNIIVKKFKDILDMDLNKDETEYIASVLITEMTKEIEHRHKIKQKD